MIYHHALCQNPNPQPCGHADPRILIDNLHPQEFKKRKAKGRVRLRSIYEAAIHQDDLIEDFDRPWIVKSTTYALTFPPRILGIGLLAVNRQIRAEALPIFFRENVFLFGDMSAIVPFLKDQSALARQNICNISLHFDVLYDDGHHPERQDECIKAVQYLSRHLTIKNLSILVMDMNLNWMDSVSFGGDNQEWIRALTQIRDLDHVCCHIKFVGDEFYMMHLGDDVEDEEELDERLWDLEDWMMETQIEYNGYLRARMLKKKQTSIDNWMKSHVCSQHCSDVSKGRVAQRDGLPRSPSNGEWTLPEVSLDTLSNDSDLENICNIGWSKSNDERDEESVDAVATRDVKL